MIAHSFGFFTLFHLRPTGIDPEIPMGVLDGSLTLEWFQNDHEIIPDVGTHKLELPENTDILKQNKKLNALLYIFLHNI